MFKDTKKVNKLIRGWRYVFRNKARRQALIKTPYDSVRAMVFRGVKKKNIGVPAHNYIRKMGRIFRRRRPIKNRIPHLLKRITFNIFLLRRKAKSKYKRWYRTNYIIPLRSWLFKQAKIIRYDKIQKWRAQQAALIKQQQELARKHGQNRR